MCDVVFNNILLDCKNNESVLFFGVFLLVVEEHYTLTVDLHPKVSIQPPDY